MIGLIISRQRSHSWYSQKLYTCVVTPGEVVLLEQLVARRRRLRQAAQDPLVAQRQRLHVDVLDFLLRRLEALHVHQTELHRVPQLVAEVAVANHALDVQIDVDALDRVRQQAEAQRVRAAHGNALGEVLTLALRRALHLGRVQVAVTDLLQHALERAAVDHVQRVDHVAQRLGHLSAVLVANHGVQVHLREGQLVAVSSSDSITIRDTQKNRMSWPVSW